MPENRALGWLPDIPSMKDYTEDHPEVSGLLARTRVASHVAAAVSQRGGSAGTKSSGGAATAVAAAAPAIAPLIDLRAYCSPIEDQGMLGSCTANAAAGLVEFMERRASGRFINASRLFIYKTTRDLLGWTGDTGAYLRTTMEALVLFGAPPEQYWAYDARPAATNPRFDVEPSAFCYAFGDSYKSIRYLRLDPAGTPLPNVLNNIRVYLDAGFASMFGFPVYNEFDHPTPAGDIAYPAPTSHNRGGHAICAVGYDDNRMIGANKGALLVRNSWGPGWGLGGYGWLSYKYVTAGLARDWWTVVSQAWVDTGNFA